MAVSKLILYLLKLVNPVLLFVCLSSSDADYTGFTISAAKGTKSSKCPDGLYSTLIFNCSESAEWSGPDISKFTQANPNVDDCQVN